MITYKLAKKLKDAGFDQGRHSDSRFIYIPTLSELIEELKGEFFDLNKLKDGWGANDHYYSATGKSPEEAVGRLYLSLKNVNMKKCEAGQKDIDNQQKQEEK